MEIEGIDEVTLAMMRSAGRGMAPVIEQLFEHAAAAAAGTAYDYDLIVGYGRPADYDDHNNHLSVVKNFKTGTLSELRHLTKDMSGGGFNLSQTFPILKNVLLNSANNWQLIPFNVLIYCRLLKSQDPDKKDYIEIKVKEKKPKEDRPIREFIFI